MIDLPLRVNGIEVKVTPVSPLAQAQKLQEINDVMQYMQIANSMGPQGQTTVAVDRVLKFIAERLGISQELLATPQEQQMMMQQLQQMMAPPEAQQAEGAIEEAMV